MREIFIEIGGEQESTSWNLAVTGFSLRSLEQSRENHWFLSGASGLKTGCRSYVCLATSIFSRCLSLSLSPFFSFFYRPSSYPSSFFNFSSSLRPCAFAFSLSERQPRSEKESPYRHRRMQRRVFSRSLSLFLSRGRRCLFGRFLEDYRAYAKLASAEGFVCPRKRFTACNFSAVVIETNITRAYDLFARIPLVYFHLLRVTRRASLFSHSLFVPRAS